VYCCCAADELPLCKSCESWLNAEAIGLFCEDASAKFAGAFCCIVANTDCAPVNFQAAEVLPQLLLKLLHPALGTLLLPF
jgi:hypothetical protein